MTYAIEAVKGLMEKLPVFGICLGHQILGLACGGQDLQAQVRPPRREPSGEGPAHRPVEVTSQNHGFAVDPALFERPEIILTHVNLNDGTVEGFRHRDLPVLSVQYHPEASPGPHDSHYLFGEFVALMKARRNAR